MDGNGVIDRYEYTTLGIVLYRVIIGDGDEKAAKESAEKDWEEDRKGKEVMDGDHFKLAIFELADLWTVSLEPAEYVRFLKDLLEKLKAKGLGGDLLAAPAPGPAPDVSVESLATLSTTCLRWKEDQRQACRLGVPRPRLGKILLLPARAAS